LVKNVRDCFSYKRVHRIGMSEVDQVAAGGDDFIRGDAF
jgi:hypothetical protein